MKKGFTGFASGEGSSSSGGGGSSVSTHLYWIKKPRINGEKPVLYMKLIIWTMNGEALEHGSRAFIP